MDSRLIWAGVTVVGMVIAAVTILLAMGRDTGALITVIGVVVTPVLMALGYGELKGMRQNSNGTMTRILDLVERREVNHSDDKRQ